MGSPERTKKSDLKNLEMTEFSLENYFDLARKKIGPVIKKNLAKNFLAEWFST